MKSKATLKDVAALAGVSTATVARVIHENGYVSEESEQRVRDALKSTDYSLNVVAQSLRQQRTNVIGHILQSTAPNPFFMQVALGVESYAREQGFNVLTFNVQNNSDIEYEAVKTFVARRVDAILFTVPVSTKNIRHAQEAGVPVVQIERPRTDDVNRIMVDNYTGAVAAMTHLIELGHRRIAFIGENWHEQNPLHHYVEVERLSAYQDTLIQYGIPIDDDLIALGHYYKIDNGGSMGDGGQLMEHILEKSCCPTAILAGSDITASGILQTLYRHGFHVPRDISLIGFDDTLARFLTPPLTTVQLPMQEMGRKAVEIAIQQMHSGIHQVTAKLSTQLIIRGSTSQVKES
jgi:DNA-binding LacI/PurR family transcriptional regulator